MRIFGGEWEDWSPQTMGELWDLMRWYAHSPPRLSNATSLKLAYGWPMKDDNDILIEMIKEAFYLAGIALQPGRWAVDSWPIRTAFLLHLNVCSQCVTAQYALCRTGFPSPGGRRQRSGSRHGRRRLILSLSLGRRSRLSVSFVFLEATIISSTVSR